MYKYETHLHTSPVSACARGTVRENLEFYKEKGYDGIFITNHFLDGNLARSLAKSQSYEDLLRFYASDYQEAVKLSQEIGIKVFFGVEMSCGGTDFLVYGLDKAWYLEHPEIMDMKYSQRLGVLCESGALVIQAHPFREASYIDHIRLFPRCVHGVEVINASRNAFENQMAKNYAENYKLIEFAGSDNHMGYGMTSLAGMKSPDPVKDEKDFVARVKCGEITWFEENCLY